jgi:hypothetical protein
MDNTHHLPRRSKVVQQTPTQQASPDHPLGSHSIAVLACVTRIWLVGDAASYCWGLCRLHNAGQCVMAGPCLRWHEASATPTRWESAAEGVQSAPSYGGDQHLQLHFQRCDRMPSVWVFWRQQGSGVTALKHRFGRRGEGARTMLCPTSHTAGCWMHAGLGATHNACKGAGA